jgi:hypothetical protein
LSGSNFDPLTAEILFSGPNCSPCTVANSVLTTKNAALLVGPATLSAAGTYTVTVQNGSGGASSNGVSLVIGGVTPSLTNFATSPSSPSVGQQFTLIINGSNFVPGLAQILLFGANCAPCTVPNSALTTVTGTQIAGPVSVNTAGSYNITVQNGSGAGQSNSLTLVIGTAAPAITLVVTSPTSPVAGQQFLIDISGNNFNPSNDEALFNGPGCNPCTLAGSALTTNGATLLIGPMTLSSAGSYTATVQNGSSGSPSNSVPLTIGAVTPTITSVSPNPVTGSNSAQAFTINGTGFSAQSTVTLWDLTAGQSFPNRTISSENSTQIVINPDFTTAADSWAVEVFNGSLGSGQFDFSVQAP